jgi:uncharacterized protein
LYVNMYGGNTLATELHDETKIKLEQTTEYPWNGKISIQVKELTKNRTKLFLRIPGWCKRYELRQNGKPLTTKNENGLVEVTVKANDKLELI